MDTTCNKFRQSCPGIADVYVVNKNSYSPDCTYCLPSEVYDMIHERCLSLKNNLLFDYTTLFQFEIN